MSLLSAFAFEPFAVNQPLLDSFLLEPDSFEFFVAAEDGPRGSGTVEDPFRVNSASQFDALMNSFPPWTTVRLGPGVFLSGGHADGVAGGWQPKRGFRILGAGIDVTTLRLEGASTENAAYFAIGTDDTTPVDEVEVAHLTIDANLSGQPVPPGQSFAALAAGGIKALGSHTRIHNLRVIDFGTQTLARPGFGILAAGGYPENPEPFDCVIEDAIVEQPAQNNVRETTSIALASREGANDGVPGFHRSCVVRNCVVNANYVDRDVAIRLLEIDDPVQRMAKATRKSYQYPSSLPALGDHDWFTLSGALEESQPSTHFNGPFQVDHHVEDLIFYFLYPAGTGNALEPTGDIFLGRAPSHRVAIKSLTVAGGVATLETWTPHYRLPDQNVVLNNVSGLNPDINGSFAINDLGSPPSPTILRFNYNDSGTAVLTTAFIGIPIYGISVGAGIGVIIEGNRVLNATCGVYHDSGSAKDVIIRDNHFSNVLAGVWYELGQVSKGNADQQPTRLGSSLNQNGALAVFTTAQPHGFLAGMLVTVTGASPNQYNGTFRIATVPSPTSFTYAMSTDPGVNASGSPVCNGRAAVLLVRNKTLATFTASAPHGLSSDQAVAVAGATPAPYNGVFALASIPNPTTFTYVMNSDPSANGNGSFAFGALWQIGRMVIEHNVIELVLPIVEGFEPPAGVRLDRTPSSPASPLSPYAFKDVVVRGNFIRHVDNASDPAPTPYSLALQLVNCERLIVEENVIKLDRASPIEFRDCGAAKFFNNQAPSGALVQGYDTGKGQFVNELATEVDLGTVLAT